MIMVRAVLSVLIAGIMTHPAAMGEEAAAAVHGRIPAGLAPVDWAIVALYAVGTIALGWYYSRRQESTSEYFTGSGRMNPILVGASLFATLLSTISYLSFPGESLGKGPVFLSTLLMLPLIYIIIAWGLLPVYMKQKVTSAYELLEARLGLSVRLLGAGMFVALRLIWMSLLVYLTAKAMTVMLGVDEKHIPLIALATGFVAVIYTSLGGLRAVIITDFFQTILLFGGALLVLILITADFGGFGWFPVSWHPHWDQQPLLPDSPATRVTVIGSMLMYLTWYICTTGGDQTTVQRFMATEDLAAARRACATQMVISAVVCLTLACVGFALLAYFEVHPEQIPGGRSLKDSADELFPHFIAFHLPVGISGLVVAAMFAAAMSSIDSGVNSITAVVMTDGFMRLQSPSRVVPDPPADSAAAPAGSEDRSRTERSLVRRARWLAFGIGALAVVGSSQMHRVPGNITAVTGKTSNLLTTPLFGLFFFALFVPFASPVGAWAGAVFGTLTAVLIAFSGPIFGQVVPPGGGAPTDPISFQWIAPCALAVNIITGCIASLLFPRPPSSAPRPPASSEQTVP